MTNPPNKIKRWREDPVFFVQSEFGVEPDEWQIDALRAFANPNHRRISLQACAGPGKSAVLAWCAWNFLCCYGSKSHHPNAAAMSITGDNLKDNLWKELSVWYNRSKFLQAAFTVVKERIFAKDHPETWFLSARSLPKKANAEEQGRTLSGLHSKYICYFIDESGDQSPNVLKSAEQGLSNCMWGKIIQAGNPTSQLGMLYQAAVPQRHLWFVVRITGDPEDPKRSKRIDKAWAEEQISLYGRENPWVMSYILGQFPPTALNALLGVEDMEAAMSRHYKETDFNFAQKRMGIDAAGTGEDPWIIWPRQGLVAFNPIEMRNPKPSEVAARVAMGKVKWGSELEFFDDGGGYASGAIDAYTRAGYSAQRVNFGGKAMDPRYHNKRAEILLNCAEWIKNGGALPKIPHIIREFTSVTYWYDKGQFWVTEKKQIKKLLGHSTDYFDALATTFALPEMPTADPLSQYIKQRERTKDYDPYDPARL